MTKIEWNQVFAWLTGIYPNWKPEAGVSAAWFDEVGAKVDQNAFRAAVRVCGAKKPCSFAIGVFEIKHEIECAKNGGDFKELAEAVWIRVLDVSRDLNRGLPAPKLRDCTRKALQTIGGFRAIGDCLEGEMKWLQKRFVEAWVLARQNEERTDLMGLPDRKIQIQGRVMELVGDTLKTFEK